MPVKKLDSLGNILKDHRDIAFLIAENLPQTKAYTLFHRAEYASRTPYQLARHLSNLSQGTDKKSIAYATKILENDHITLKGLKTISNEIEDNLRQTMHSPHSDFRHKLSVLGFICRIKNIEVELPTEVMNSWLANSSQLLINDTPLYSSILKMIPTTQRDMLLEKIRPALTSDTPEDITPFLCICLPYFPETDRNNFLEKLLNHAFLDPQQPYQCNPKYLEAINRLGIYFNTTHMTAIFKKIEEKINNFETLDLQPILKSIHYKLMPNQISIVFNALMLLPETEEKYEGLHAICTSLNSQQQCALLNNTISNNYEHGINALLKILTAITPEITDNRLNPFLDKLIAYIPKIPPTSQSIKNTVIQNLDLVNGYLTHHQKTLLFNMLFPEFTTQFTVADLPVYLFLLTIARDLTTATQQKLMNQILTLEMIPINSDLLLKTIPYLNAEQINALLDNMLLELPKDIHQSNTTLRMFSQIIAMKPDKTKIDHIFEVMMPLLDHNNKRTWIYSLLITIGPQLDSNQVSQLIQKGGIAPQITNANLARSQCLYDIMYFSKNITSEQHATLLLLLSNNSLFITSAIELNKFEIINVLLPNLTKEKLNRCLNGAQIIFFARDIRNFCSWLAVNHPDRDVDLMNLSTEVNLIIIPRKIPLAAFITAYNIINPPHHTPTTPSHRR